jgi:peptidoglycan-associated lipoprotein
MTTITIVRTAAVCALALTTTLVGCATRPSVTSTATAPGGPPAAATPAAADSAAAPAIVVEEQREVVVVERPDPASFTENPNVKPVYFDFDRYEIRDGDTRTLETDASWLKTNDMLVLIEGQCDERGTDAYNLALGDRRARAAMNYLVAQGVASDRISIVSYGKERPVCTEHTEACWALNRRAHILVKPRG